MLMSIRKRQKNVLLPIVLAALSALLVFTIWLLMTRQGPSQVMLFDMAIYTSIDELSTVSEAVVLGTVKGVVAREIDYGTADPVEQLIKGQGMPTVFYEVVVMERLYGETEDTIVVAAPDAPKGSLSDSVTILQEGEQVVLFLKHRSAGEAPGITTYDNFYVTVSLDNGVFDLLEGGQIKPRLPDVFDVVSYSLADVRENLRR